MTGQIEEMFNKIKDDEMSLPEFVEWVGKIMDQADSAGYSRGYGDGCDVGFESANDQY